MILVLFILHMLFEAWILEVDISYTRRVLARCRIIAAVFIISSGEALELHYVLRKRTSLVTEDIVHHTQLFIQV